MTILEKKVDAICRLVLNPEDEKARKALEAMSKGPAMTLNPEDQIRNLLLELGAPDHLTGHPYLVEGILMCLDDYGCIKKITSKLYPEIAVKFNTTAGRTERAIRHVIEVVWSRGNPDVLAGYFGNTVSADKGKPTNGEFIARLTNVVKRRLNA